MVKLDKVYTVIPFYMWGYITAFLPLGGFILCVIIAILLHFDTATKTHCGVFNFLPSISAAVGDATPERYIWRICIAYHCLPRTIIIPSFYARYWAEYSLKLRSVAFSVAWKAAIILHVMENLCLVLLSFVSSRENYSVHEKSFITFMACATIYMMLCLWMTRKMQREVGLNAAQTKALKIRYFAFTSNITIFIISIILFIRHNTHCEPLVYSGYAACEYYIVFSNVLFHSAAMVEFPRLCAVVADVDQPSWVEQKASNEEKAD